MMKCCDAKRWETSLISGWIAESLNKHRDEGINEEIDFGGCTLPFGKLLIFVYLLATK